MNNITERLGAIAHQPTTYIADAVVSGDLRRGRAALKRNRIRGVAGGALAVAAVAIVAAVGIGSILSTAPSDEAKASQHPSTPMRLVAYTGTQLPGFTVAQVPDGFVLQSAKDDALIIGRVGGETDSTPTMTSYVDKIAVTLQSKAGSTSSDGLPVTVNGHAGTISTPNGGGRWLEYNDGSHDIVVQVWKSIHLTDTQLVRFAEGITVSANAQGNAG